MKKLKTKAWPNGREWPDELALDVGSSMPTDVYGLPSVSSPGVLFVRHDVAAKRTKEALASQQARIEQLEKQLNQWSNDEILGETDRCRLQKLERQNLALSLENEGLKSELANLTR